MATRMQQRRGTAAEWSAANPILADGEVGFVRDTNIIKIGNGLDTWSALPVLYVEQAGNANTLDGLDSTQFLRSTAKAVDSDKIDGIDSAALAKLAGATFTGLVTASAGLDTRQGGSSKAAADIPSTYPVGLTTWNVTTTNGWPGNGVLFNDRLAGSTYTTQLLLPVAADGRIYTRSQVSGTSDTWTAWTTFLNSTDKVPDSNLLDGLNSATASTANTIVARDASGYVSAVLFRSEYDTTNATCNFIMTQVDTATNNYLRPSTPAQIATALPALSAKATHTTSISLATSTGVLVPWQTVEFDTNSFRTTDNTKMKIPFNGKYLVIATIRFATHNLGMRNLYLRVNAATVANISQPAGNDSSGMTITLTTIRQLVAGDLLDIIAFQSSGATIGTDPGTADSEFSVMRIGA